MESRSAYSWSRASTTSFARAIRGIVGRVVGSDRAEKPEEQRLLAVQAVLGLIPHHGAGAVDHLVGDLLAPVGGEAVHHDRVGGRPVQGRLVDAIASAHQG